MQVFWQCLRIYKGRLPSDNHPISAFGRQLRNFMIIWTYGLRSENGVARKGSMMHKLDALTMQVLGKRPTTVVMSHMSVAETGSHPCHHVFSLPQTWRLVFLEGLIYMAAAGFRAGLCLHRC